MPVLSTFDPQYQASGRTANRYVEGLDAGASLMERAQTRKIREQDAAIRQQQADQQRQEFQAKLPLIQATAQAGVVSAAASVANATRLENLRAKAAESSVDYNDRYLNILSIPDPQDKADSLAALQGEVAWMETIPEYKGFVTAVNNARASAATMTLTNAKVDEAIEKARITQEALNNRAVIGAEQRATTGAGHDASRERVAGAQVAGRVAQEVVRGRNAANRAGDSVSHLQDLAADADQDAADASARGDEDAAKAHRAAAQSYRDGVKKATTFAGGVQGEVPSESPAGGRAEPQRPKEEPITSSAPAVSVDLTGGGKAAPKLYVADEGKPPTLAPTVKTPQQILDAVQQMVDDGVMDADEARATLTKLGFRPKR